MFLIISILDYLLKLCSVHSMQTGCFYCLENSSLCWCTLLILVHAFLIYRVLHWDFYWHKNISQTHLLPFPLLWAWFVWRYVKSLSWNFISVAFLKSPEPLFHCFGVAAWWQCSCCLLEKHAHSCQWQGRFQGIVVSLNAGVWSLFVAINDHFFETFSSIVFCTPICFLISIIIFSIVLAFTINSDFALVSYFLVSF